MDVKTKYYKEVLAVFDTFIVSTKAINSGNHYTGQIAEFLVYLEQEKVFSLTGITEKLMMEYVNYLEHRPKKRGIGTLSVSTINDNMSTLRMFSNCMVTCGRIKKGFPVRRNIKVERDDDSLFTISRPIATEQEMREILHACISDRERALIVLAYGCGLRRSELSKLKDLNIDYTDGIITVIKSKRNKTREVTVSSVFLKLLQNYGTSRLKLLHDKQSETEFHFVDDRGLAMSGDELNELLKEIIGRTVNQQLIDKHLTLHCLRHSIATHMMDRGLTFDEVRQFLGHSLIDTTFLYARRRNQQKCFVI